MKQVSCAVMLILGLAAGAGAEEGDLWFGVRGGPGLATLLGTGNELSEGFSTIVTPNVGLVTDYFFTNYLALQVELNYSVQGGERDGFQPFTQVPPGLSTLPTLPPGQYFYADFHNKNVLDYLEIPLLAKIQEGLSEHWSWFIEAGPYVGFLLKAEQQTSGASVIYTDKDRGNDVTPGPVSFHAKTDIKDRLHEVNVGLTAGIGVAYTFRERHQVFLDIRGQFGLIPLQENEDIDGRSRTGAVLFLLGYMVRLGG